MTHQNGGFSLSILMFFSWGILHIVGVQKQLPFCTCPSPCEQTLPPGAKSHSNSSDSPATNFALYQVLFTYWIYWLLELTPLSIKIKQAKELETGPRNHHLAHLSLKYGSSKESETPLMLNLCRLFCCGYANVSEYPIRTIEYRNMKHFALVWLDFDPW